MKIKVGQTWVDPSDGENVIIVKVKGKTIYCRTVVSGAGYSKGNAHAEGYEETWVDESDFKDHYELSETERIKIILKNYEM